MDDTILNKASNSKQTRQPEKDKEKFQNKEVKVDHTTLGEAEETEGARMGSMHPKNI
jgi:hypothetical protein